MTSNMRVALALSEGKHRIQAGWCKFIRVDSYNNVCALGAIDEGLTSRITPMCEACVEALYEVMTDEERTLGLSTHTPQEMAFLLAEQPLLFKMQCIAQWNNHWAVTKNDVVGLFDRAYSFVILSELAEAEKFESICSENMEMVEAS